MSNFTGYSNDANVVVRESRCICCEKKISNEKYCSKQCMFKHKRDSRREEIISTGKLIDYRRDKWFIIETRGRKCEKCGILEWTGVPVPLVLDHIDGNSDDSSLNNVRLICHNCNALTPTFCGKNKGKGRNTIRGTYRNKRYSDGKSY